MPIPVGTVPGAPCPALRTTHSSTPKLVRSVEWRPGKASSKRLKSLESRRAKEPTSPIVSLTRASRRSFSLIRCVRWTATKGTVVVPSAKLTLTQMSAPLMVQQTGSDSVATAPVTKITTNKYAKAFRKEKEGHSKDSPQVTTSPSSTTL